MTISEQAKADGAAKFAAAEQGAASNVAAGLAGADEATRLRREQRQPVTDTSNAFNETTDVLAERVKCDPSLMDRLSLTQKIALGFEARRANTEGN